MFIRNPDWRRLRQGDVCALPYYAIWDWLSVLKVVDSSDSLTHVTLPLRPRNLLRDGNSNDILVAVCSQCCDLGNSKGRGGIAIAPIRPTPLRSADVAGRKLFAESYRPIDKRWSWFHLFPLMLPGEEGEELVAVDWSTITTLAPHREACDTLLAGKRQQLRESYRAHFRKKLAASFGRKPTEEGWESPSTPEMELAAVKAADVRPAIGSASGMIAGG